MFGIVSKQNWEECFKLLLKRLILEKLFKRVGIQKLSRVWVLEVWHNPAFVGLTCILDLNVPSGEQILDVAEELMMKFL